MSVNTSASTAAENPGWLAQKETVLEVLNEGVIIVRDGHRIFLPTRSVEKWPASPGQLLRKTSRIQLLA